MTSKVVAKADSAAKERVAARAEFEKGQEALNGNNPSEALTHFKAAKENRFADAGTRDQADAQIAAASASIVATRSARPVVGHGMLAGWASCRDTCGRPSPPGCHRNNPWYRSVRVSGSGALDGWGMGAADTTTHGSGGDAPVSG